MNSCHTGMTDILNSSVDIVSLLFHCVILFSPALCPTLFHFPSLSLSVKTKVYSHAHSLILSLAVRARLSAVY